MMNRILLTLCLCAGSLMALAQYGTQFENRGFEEWANFTSNNSASIEPIGWHSTMSADGSFAGFLSQQMEPSNITRPGSTGQKSARLWAKSVVGVIANGNLTNGRMHAGSMTPSGSNNYNYPLRSDERFNTPVNMVPDSLTLWACFRCSNPYQNAQVRAIVHGDTDLQVKADGSMEPENLWVAAAAMAFQRTSEAGVDYQWRRLSIPFTNNGPCSDPRYILVTMTTNSVPGEGATSDELFIDDVLLVYQPALEMLALDKDHYDYGESLIVHFNLEGTMSPENLGGLPNQVIAQLSNATGSFSNPTELGRITTNASGSLNVTSPSSIPYGVQYRIRVVSTNYPMISEDNGTNLTIGSNVEVAETLKENEVLTVEVFDLSGRRIGVFSSVTPSLDGSSMNLAPGLYIAKCQRSNQSFVQKMLVP